MTPQRPSPQIPGYHGFWLRIDLSARSAARIPLAGADLQDYVGGVGLGTRLLLRTTGGQCYEALSPEAPLIFVFSPLVGSPLTTSAKFAVVAKSPLTARLNDSLASSHFAIAGKRCGVDALVIVGRASEPTVVAIDDGQVRFLPATRLWGCSSAETGEQLRRELGPGYRTAAIGVAGERLVRFATVSHDGRHAGRGGMGAVMGSKRLKALAVKGTQHVEYACPPELVAYSRDLSQRSLGPGTAKYRELGTVSNLLTFNRLGVLPTRNFQAGTTAQAEQILPQLTAGSPDGESEPQVRESCAACTIGCEHLFAHPDRRQNGVRLEYESVFSLGPLCGVVEHAAIVTAVALCDELGMDTISAGATLAFAMECAERGLLETRGLRFGTDLRFGNGAALPDLLRQIAYREGIGDLLANGSRAAAQEIGGGSQAFAPHVKGLEIPGYDPRGLQTMALGFSVGTRGADHNRSGAYQADFSDQVNRLQADERSVRLAIETENEAAVMDSLILCKFLRGVFPDRWQAMGEMLRLTTGWERTREQLVQTAERIITARKQFNISQGWTPEEDTLPDRFFELPLPDGVSRGAVLDREQLARLIRDYNIQRGWSPEGWLPSEPATHPSPPAPQTP